MNRAIKTVTNAGMRRNSIFMGAQHEKRKIKGTFIVNVMFRENATWQGVVYWRETRSRQNFRSFLELTCLMDTAVRDAAGWESQTDKTRQIADI